MGDFACALWNGGMNQDLLDAYHGHLEFARVKVIRSRYVQPWERGFLKRPNSFAACPPSSMEGGILSASQLGKDVLNRKMLKMSMNRWDHSSRSIHLNLHVKRNNRGLRRWTMIERLLLSNGKRSCFQGFLIFRRVCNFVRRDWRTEFRTFSSTSMMYLQPNQH